VHRWLRPTIRTNTIYDVDACALAERGIRGVILDLDNTIVPWGAREAPQALTGWIEGARAAGLALCIVSNNGGQRVEVLSRRLGLPVLTGAMKPRRGALRRALAVMGTTADTTALIGDQVFTDVLGGNRLGLCTILVQPQSTREFILTRFVRLVERMMLRDIR